MNIRLRLQDRMSAALRERLARVGDTTPLAVAAAMELKSWAEQAFDSPDKRPTPWAPRKGGGTHPLLKRHGLLWRSFRVNAVGNGAAQLVTDRPYAAAHQFGSRSAKGRGGGIPPRPFFPFDLAGNLMPAAHARVLATIRRRVETLFRGQ